MELFIIHVNGLYSIHVDHLLRCSGDSLSCIDSLLPSIPGSSTFSTLPIFISYPLCGSSLILNAKQVSVYNNSSGLENCYN